MSKFTLDPSGVQYVNQGIGSIFKALAQAPLIQQQAEQQAALRTAQAYHANMTGNKAGAEAESERYTLGQRQNVPSLIAADPDMPAYMQAAYKLFGATGDTNADRLAKAGSEFQTQGMRDKAVSNIGDTTLMNKYISVAADKPYMPFDNIGNTGYSLDKATGKGGVADATLAKLFGNTQNALTNERNASAGQHSAAAKLSNERVKAIQQGELTDGTDDDGNPIVYRSGTARTVEVVPGVAPLLKPGGSEAALQKQRGRIVEQVYKDLNVLPEDRENEVERRMKLVAPDKSAAPSPAASSMSTPPVTLLKEGVVTTFRNGQKWKLEGGKPVKVN